MISEFQELSDKIDQLAEMVQTLRSENAKLRSDNAHLRQGNAGLVAQTIDYHNRMTEATARVEALLQKIPPLDGAADELPENEDVR